MTAPIITERRVIGMFYERLMQALGLSWVEPISTPIIRSDQDSETYAWVGMVPQMSQKTGQKKFSQLRTTKWDVKNVEYQGGIAIPKKHVLYDKTDQIMVRVNELAERVVAHWVSLIAPLVVGAASAVCYDGQYFFDTDHSEGKSGTQSNDITVDISALPVSNHGSTTAPSAAEMMHAILAGVMQILGFKDDQGELVNENMTDFLVVVPVSLLPPALAAVTAPAIDGADSNIIVNQDTFNIRVVASPRLTMTDAFPVFATQGTQKPIIRQQRVPNNAAPGYTTDGMLIETLWLDSEHCKLHNEVLVSVETERAAAYGDWKKACLVTLV